MQCVIRIAQLHNTTGTVQKGSINRQLAPPTRGLLWLVCSKRPLRSNTNGLEIYQILLVLVLHYMKSHVAS